MTQSLIQRVRRDGLRGTLKGVWLSVRPTQCGIYRLGNLVGETGKIVSEVKNDLEALRNARAGRTDLADEFYYDLTRGYTTCRLITRDGKLAGVLWVLTECEGSRYIELRDGDVELGGVYVLHQFRGQGLARGLLRATCRQLRQEQQCDIYAAIADWNIGSYRAFAAVGFRKITQIRRPLRFGPRYVPRRSRVESWWEAIMR